MRLMVSSTFLSHDAKARATMADVNRTEKIRLMFILVEFFTYKDHLISGPEHSGYSRHKISQLDTKGIW